MASRIFVSYNFSDRDVVHTVHAFTRQYQQQVDGQFALVEDTLEVVDPIVIDAEIRRVMSRCDAAFFAIGNNNHNSPWIEREAQLAISMGLHVVMSQLPNTYGGEPRCLSSRGYPWVEWSASGLALHLNRLQRRR